MAARGDVVSSGAGDPIQLDDVIGLLTCLFTDVDECPPCVDSVGDANADGRLDVSDPLYLLRYIFLQDLPPSAPFPNCGNYYVASTACCREDYAEQCR